MGALELAMEFAVMLFQLFYALFEAILLTLIPRANTLKSVKGQTVLITGAGSGIGRLIALRFAWNGAVLVLWDINQDGNEETARQVREIGAKAFAYQCDLSSRDAVYEAAKEVKTEVGDVDILVNNAGIVTGKKFLECPDALIEKTMQVNTMAHFWTTKAFLPSMLKRNHGHVVSIASSAGIIGVNGLADYCASKFGAVGFDESLREELFAKEKDGVHTTVVCPFFINTGMFDGVKTRFPSVLPIVEPGDAVDRIMIAILTNAHVLYIPRVLNVFLGLKGILPVKCTVLLGKFFGTSAAMDDFVGRKAEAIGKKD